MKEMYFNEGVFTSDGEMRYYYADGRISNLKLPQVFINWGEPKDYSFYFSSFPLHGAGFYRIGDHSEQMGGFSSNFQYVAPINSGYINGLNGFSIAIGAKTNLIEAAVRYHFKSAHSFREFNHLRPKQIEFRYNKALGKAGLKYLRGYEKLGKGISAVSATMETVNFISYSVNNGLYWDVAAKYSLDMTMTLIGTFGGPVGFVVSTTYFILDVSTDGFGGFGKMY